MQGLYPPTPPYSPQALHPLSCVPNDSLVEDPLRNTIVVLDTLIDSCQRRRMWVYQLRANLETAESDSSGSQTFSPASSDESSYDVYRPQDDQALNGTNAPTNSRWTRRKRGFKLPRLEGISPKPRRTISPQSDCADPYASPSRDDILSMYEKIIESRMESCQRINKMIHNANRANLHNR